MALDCASPTCRVSGSSSVATGIFLLGAKVYHGLEKCRLAGIMRGVADRPILLKKSGFDKCSDGLWAGNGYLLKTCQRGTSSLAG